MSNNAHELSNRLLNALDNNYNVVDMHTVNEIISILERINITKELLETTRLGKHVNELRRKTSDPSLARRAKVLVKRWRDLVIPTVASPGHTGSNRSSAERQVRQRLGGTPLTSPALSRVVSPAVPSPRPPSRPAWGGYESDSQDVILVDDEPPPKLLSATHKPLSATHKPLTPPVKRPPSPEPLYDEKKAKRDKKPKKRRGIGRAGGTEPSAQVLAPPAPPPAATPAPVPLAPTIAPAPAPAPAHKPWSGRNGSTHERRRNGCRRDKLDPYTALVKKMPAVGVKKVKTTAELLEEIQSRGSKPAASPAQARSPASPASPASPDVLLIEPDAIKAESPVRNGGGSPRPASPRSPAGASPPRPPLEDEREQYECTCGEDLADTCPAAPRGSVRPLHVHALHHAYLPGVNGTRAPLVPHRFAVRKAEDLDRPGLFASVVPLYKYSDYADDFCAKNMSRVPLLTHLPFTEFAPPPPDPPPPPSPPPIRPYPVDTVEEKGDESDSETKTEVKEEPEEPLPEPKEEIKVEAEMVGIPTLEPGERLKAPILTAEDETQFGRDKCAADAETERDFVAEQRDHRTVERTKAEAMDGRTLYELCRRAVDGIPYDYEQLAGAPVVTLPECPAALGPALDDALERSYADTERDELCRPARPPHFAEWHECVQLGSLIALPYVVID